jgi:hypothetical protein
MAPRPAIFAGLAGIIVAAAVAAVAIPSLLAAWTVLPVADSIDRMRKGLPVDPKEATAALDASLRAGRIFDKGRYFSDAALAAGRLPAAQRSSLPGGASLPAIVDEALISKPTSPHNWARRAQLLLDAGNVAGARAALETSLVTGRFVPGLTVPRLRIILRLLRRGSDPEMERSFDDQVRIAARTEPYKLALFADGGAAEGRTQRILGTEYRLYDAYLKALMGKRAVDQEKR